MPSAARPALVALVALAGCSRDPASSNKAQPAPTTSTASAIEPGPAVPHPLVAIDALTSDACVFGHRGVLIDLGDAARRGQVAALDRTGRVEATERDGATWARVLSRGIAVHFVATAEDVAATTDDGATPVIEARVRGGAARSVVVSLNGRAAGTWTLTKGEARVVALKLPVTPPSTLTPGAPTNGAQIVAGTNELVLRFRGAARGGASEKDEEAEIDWVHAGGHPRVTDGSEDTDYAAPTRAESIASVTLGGAVKRAALLRAPGYARCVGWLPAGGHLVGSVGVSAPAAGGEADVELRAERDRAPPLVLASMHLTANGPWRSFDLPLDKVIPTTPESASSVGAAASRGTLGAIALVAVRATKGVRVTFGEPRVEVTAPPAPAPIAPVRGAVLVVLGNIAPRSIDLYSSASDAIKMPELDALAKGAITFDAHRASCGAGSCALASMLTGLPARGHGVIDDEAGLAPEVTTLADVARQAGIRAAMFTSNPTTSSPFGFGRGWDTFVAHPPEFNEPRGSGLAPFDEAAAWITENAKGDDAGKFLIVIHARGGHPPWEVSPEDMRSLPPADYTGSLDPQTAAELLARARPRIDSKADAPGPHPPSMHLTDADRVRVWALYALALRSTDAALGRVVTALKAAGRADDTLVVVSGDVGLGDARAPLEDPDVLDESSLVTPLVVRFPRETSNDEPAAARHVAAPTVSGDVGRTIVSAFGLSLPTPFGTFADLSAVAAGVPDPRGRPSVAWDGAHLSLGWGSFVLRGIAGETAMDVTKLCDRTLEPACTSDVRGAFPLALLALERELGAAIVPPHAIVPVVEAPTLRSSLKLWGL